MGRHALTPNCPQCGGPVDVPEGAAYVRCGYCSAESFVDLSGALLHQVVKATIGRSRVPALVKARALEAGWPAVTVTDLDLVYEPVWEVESLDGRRLRIGARPGPEGRFSQANLPGGERAFIDDQGWDQAAEWIDPELAPESLPEVAARVTGRPVAVKTVRLLHHPVYAGQVRLADASYSFRVDAVGGQLIDADWPVHSAFTYRNRAWLATAAMVAVAALLPLPVAVVLVVAIGGLSARVLWRRSAVPSPVPP
ncbi:MAG: hypothetical protein PVJ43_08685 [Gemmatimonadales bacterium]